MEDEIRGRQRHGQELYRRGKYKEALDCFSSIVSEVANPPLSVLDNRAAAYSRLGDHKTALKDAKRMIHSAKQNTSGYLRAGMLLVKLEETDKALQIYEYGLKNVPVTDSEYSTLRGMHEKLSKLVGPKFSFDPFRLPLELIDLVLAHFTLKHMVHWRRVCKRWKMLIEGSASYAESLDLSEARKKVSFTFVKNFVRLAGSRTTKVILKNVAGGESSAISFLTSRCPLESLTVLNGFESTSFVWSLSTANNLTHLVLGPSREISHLAAAEILTKCLGLKEVEFHRVLIRSATRLPAKWPSSLPNLVSIYLRPSHFSNTDLMNLDMLLAAAPNLQHFYLHDNWNSFAFPDYSAYNLIGLSIGTARSCTEPLLLPRSLRSFAYSGLTNDSWQNAIVSLPKLERLRASYLGLQSDPRWIDILLAQNTGTLKRLVIQNPWDRIEQNARDVGRMLELLDKRGVFKNLDEFHLKTWFSDNFFENLNVSLKLKHLDLSANNVFTGAGLRQMVEKSGDNLRTVVLHGCANVSPDTVTMLRDRGLIVDYRPGEITGFVEMGLQREL